ncbi:MAG: dTDP-4-dehydrorhamnose 3,5-epimerase [Candidatus Omnitrophica bacterium]|nr:dTDP-4-dehydrorhamnose 3,5-epimerase [Candidatus Omnitrophota bacterium]
MSFTFKRLEIPDVILIEPRVLEDERGFFMETYKWTDFTKFGIKERFIQDNHSKSVAKGVLRGLHFQKEPMGQAKLVRVIAGSVFDVAVDIRRDSPTYGKWISVVLSAKNKKMLYIPEGFAHGFCTLEKDSEVIYKCSNIYSPEHERGIIWNDKDINIQWPIENPILSEKDSKLPLLDKIDSPC